MELRSLEGFPLERAINLLEQKFCCAEPPPLGVDLYGNKLPKIHKVGGLLNSTIIKIEMKIIGQKIELVPAKEADREKIFSWLTQSDLTSSMFLENDHSIPSWEEFCTDYTSDFFNTTGDGKGRNYIILQNNMEIGTIGYDLLDRIKERVVLDIWMKSEKYCGKGYGSEALETLCKHLYKTHNITNFVISPSIKNERAIAAYMKAGFGIIKTLTKEEQEDEFGLAEYAVNVLMMKSL